MTLTQLVKLLTRLLWIGGRAGWSRKVHAAGAYELSREVGRVVWDGERVVLLLKPPDWPGAKERGH